MDINEIHDITGTDTGITLTIFLPLLVVMDCVLAVQIM